MPQNQYHKVTTTTTTTINNTGTLTVPVKVAAMKYPAMTKITTLHNLTFVFKETCFDLAITTPDNFNIKDIYNSVYLFLEELSSISQKGYVNEVNIKKLPIYSDFISIFTKDKSFIRGTETAESLK